MGDGEASKQPILIVGAGGMLGTALVRVAPELGHTARAYTEQELDITDRAALGEAVARFAGEISKGGAAGGGETAGGGGEVAGAVEATGAVINSAAYTDVERAEDDAERAYLINELAASWVAEAARENGLAMVHVSTDFVFDGTKGAPYSETDATHPLSVYGASKLAGERSVLAAHPTALVIRTAWTYGPGGTNFPLKILQRAKAAIEDADPAKRVLRVVTDEVGCPTYSVDLATGLLGLLSAGATGLFHLAGAGFCSRYELALEALRLAGFDVPGELTVEPVPSAMFPMKAVRPQTAVLDCGKAAQVGVRLPAWQDGLSRFLAEL